MLAHAVSTTLAGGMSIAFSLAERDGPRLPILLICAFLTDHPRPAPRRDPQATVRRGRKSFRLQHSHESFCALAFIESLVTSSASKLVLPSHQCPDSPGQGPILPHEWHQLGSRCGSSIGTSSSFAIRSSRNGLSIVLPNFADAKEHVPGRLFPDEEESVCVPL